MINVEEHEQNTGWRGVFHALPSTRNTAHKIIMPLGYFYSPFLPDTTPIKTSPVYCAKCKAALSSFCTKNKNTKTWVCSFCLTTNPLPYDVGLSQVEQYVEGKSNDNGLFFVIDLCLSGSELEAVKQSLKKVIESLPQNLFVGLLAFNRNIFIYDFEDQSTKFTCLSGIEDYGPPPFLKLRDHLGLSIVDPKFVNKVIATRHYVILNPHNREKILKAVNSLRADTHKVPRDQREKRATGAAFQTAVGLVSELGINTRFVCTIGGPGTVGVGRVVNLPLKNTIRSYVDIIENNEAVQHVTAATAFYEGLSSIIVKNRHTMDIWSYGLDQFGLMQMKGMVNGSGGMLAMHELFNHFIFQNSFQKFYQTSEDGLMSYPVAAQLTIRCSKEIKINGILGLGKSLKENTLKTAAEMEIGEGGTNVWYIGGISTNASLCLVVSLSEANASQNKERTGDIQAAITYKWSDNILRTRVSTIRLEYLRDNQALELGKRFDEEAAVVMLARMAAKKAEVEDVIEVKKWVDRILLKFAVKFAHFSRNDKGSFRLPNTMKHFPQFIYHLRRSTFINPFGYPPDQAIYVKTCLMRESIPNCMVMIQPALIRYTAEANTPVPVELDINELQEDVILLLDSYFNVLIWYGQNAYSWKQQNMQEDPEYQHLKQFFEMPMQDASDIMYDRLPVSNFYETFKNDGKERYLKSKVNPAKSNKIEDDGHFVSDDAPITLFMDYLVRSVINYNE